MLCRLLWQILTDASLAGSPFLKVGLNRLYGVGNRGALSRLKGIKGSIQTVVLILRHKEGAGIAVGRQLAILLLQSGQRNIEG